MSYFYNKNVKTERKQSNLINIIQGNDVTKIKTNTTECQIPIENMNVLLKFPDTVQVEF